MTARSPQVERALARFGARAGALLGLEVGRVRLFEGDAGWRVTLDTAETQLRLTSPSSAPALFTHPAYALSYRRCDPPGWGDVLSRRATPDRRDALADALRALRAAARLPAPELAPLASRTAAFGAEAPLLTPLARAFRQHYGRELELARWPSGPPSILFPDVVPAQSVFFRVSPSFAEDALMRAYLQDLGYGVRGAKLRLVPTPAAFQYRRTALGQTGEGFTPRLVHAPVPVLGARAWLRGLSRGIFTVNVYGTLRYGLTRAWREVGRRVHSRSARTWHTHFHALGHDMGLHVFSLHRLPPATMASLRALAARGAFGSRREAAAVARHIEEDLTRRCASVWDTLEHPDEFRSRFAALPHAANGLYEPPR